MTDVRWKLDTVVIHGAEGHRRGGAGSGERRDQQRGARDLPGRGRDRLGQLPVHVHVPSLQQRLKKTGDHGQAGRDRRPFGLEGGGAGRCAWAEDKYPDFRLFKERKGKLAYIDKVWREIHINFGTTQSPFQSYLTLIGLDTLAVRRGRHMSKPI